ncbi:MAG TPA: hypothetical protein VEX67_11080 [Solirubrobacteraceae bacterium]|nr:hypothetical protein [Solirubrobacteraceae bacterium]
MLFAGVLVVLVVLAVVVLARGSSDEPELKVINGAAAADFPLRGDLARDSAAIRAAADAWLAHDARADGDSRVLDHDDDVTMRALWAGRLRGTKSVILAAGHHAAVVEVESDDASRVQTVSEQIREADDPGVVVFDQAVLVDTEADPVFKSALVRPDGVAPLDGLWTTAGPNAASSLPDGALVLRAGLRRSVSSRERTAPAAIIVSNPSSIWLIDAALEAKLVPGSRTFSPPAYQRLVAATTPGLDGEVDRSGRHVDPPELRLVQDRSLPVLGPTMVLTAESRKGRDRVLAAHGGSLVRGKDEAEPKGLGERGTDDGDAAYGEDGPAFAAAIVGTPRQPNQDLSVFVAGSSQIETIEVLTGRERVTRPGPVAVVPLPAATDLRAGEPARPRGDLAVLGRTRAGTLVVPSGVRAR